MQLDIRKLEAGDAEAISRIYASITQSSAGADFRQGIEDQAANRRNASFVAEYQGKVVGYLSGTILTGSFGIEKSALVDMLGVKPDMMGRGIGERLAKVAFAHYRDLGITSIHTTVRWDSTDLLSFFKTLGFDRSNFINLHKTLP